MKRVGKYTGTIYDLDHPSQKEIGECVFLAVDERAKDISNDIRGKKCVWSRCPGGCRKSLEDPR